jgi:hypothetical protein
MASSSFSKVSAKKVAKPKISGGQFGAQKPKSLKKVYTKNALRADPTEFTNVSFGRTGLTGMS